MSIPFVLNPMGRGGELPPLIVAAGETLNLANATVNRRIINNGTINFSGASTLHKNIDNYGLINVNANGSLTAPTQRTILCDNAHNGRVQVRGGASINNIIFDGGESVSGRSNPMFFLGSGASATDCVFKNAFGALNYSAVSFYQSVTFSGCRFIDNNANTYFAFGNQGLSTFDSCYFNKNNNKMLLLYCNVIFNNCQTPCDAADYTGSYTATFSGVQKFNYFTSFKYIRIKTGSIITLTNKIQSASSGSVSVGDYDSDGNWVVGGSFTLIDTNGVSHTISGTGTYINGNGTTDLQ